VCALSRVIGSLGPLPGCAHTPMTLPLHGVDALGQPRAGRYQVRPHPSSKPPNRTHRAPCRKNPPTTPTISSSATQMCHRHMYLGPYLHSGGPADRRAQYSVFVHQDIPAFVLLCLSAS
jgi:hypothetical protein